MCTGQFLQTTVMSGAKQDQKAPLFYTRNGLIAKHIDHKKMQEKAKRELDVILQSWQSSSEGVAMIRNEENTMPFQESYPSQMEEIEGSNCSSLQYLYECENRQIKSSIKDKIDPNFRIKQNTDEQEFAAELCHKVGDVLKCEDFTSSKSEKNRNLSTEEEMSNKVLNVQEENKMTETLEKSLDEKNALLNLMEKPAISDVSLSVEGAGSGVHNTSFRPDSTASQNHLCFLCRKCYTTSSHLSRHIKTAHGNQQVHECNICNTRFTRAESLIRHLKIHENRNGTNKMSNSGPFKCPKCPKTYQQAYNVTRHLLSHTGEKPFKCTECNKTFTQYTGLSRHLVLHKGSKDFKCKECGKMFARLFVLNRHMLTHTDDKPFKCFVCSKSFIRASQLSSHMHSHKKTSKSVDQEFQ